FSFFQADGENTFSELLTAFNSLSLGAVLISVLSIVVLVYWNKTPLKKYKFFPSSLFIVMLGVVMNELYKLFAPNLIIQASHLVSIPIITNPASFVTFPNFSSITNTQVWIVAVTIAIVASLETLLNLEAVTNLDPEKRLASPNRELVAQGVGNIFSGLLGGLPVTSVIVRSSVNIEAGARSKWSAVLHGGLLLISVFFLRDILNRIPLASLAAILIYTGYKLANALLFKKMYRKGSNQFIPFLITITAILFTDLLVGVLIGLAICVYYLLKINYKNPFDIDKDSTHGEETIKIKLANQLSFLNKGKLKETLGALANDSKVVIDASDCDFIDYDVLEVIYDFEHTISKNKNIKLNIIGQRITAVVQHKKINDHITFTDVFDKETQQKLSPNDVLAILQKGNDRFINGTTTEKYLKQQMNATATSQSPIAVVLSCIDSRTTTEHVFDLGLGDIFSVRVAGNILNEDILGSMEFATKIVGTKLVVVLGHTKCGAIAGACNNIKMGNLTAVLNKIQPAVLAEETITLNRDGDNMEFVNKVSTNNVHLTIERIRAESPIIRELENTGQVKLVGAMYDIKTGKVNFY
ncbi:MAG: bifunctional SulP family inorganic anion transporter/carbonic anhydrase, partial [Bacteroidia bacterium]|nr:bifunctional SulP family inorganic anion transporter/carbonic anhydrase [Bacteroidia bacterium]